MCEIHAGVGGYLDITNIYYLLLSMYHIMEDQDELIIIRKSECEELGLEANTKAVLEDVD